MADIRQNTDVLGAVTADGAGATTPFKVLSAESDGSNPYTHLKLTNTASGTVFEINNQSASLLLGVTTAGVSIGGDYVLPYAAPSATSVLGRATAAGAGSLSWISLDHTYISDFDTEVASAVTTEVANTTLNDLFDVSISSPSDGQALVYESGSWVNAFTPLTVEVHNDSGATIVKGKPVYVSGQHTSGKPTIALANGLISANATPSIGLVQADISNNSDGIVVIGGTIDTLDTTSFSAGDALYLDATAGNLTTTRPTSSFTHVQKVAIVSRSHASAGSIIVMGAGRVNDIPNDISIDDLSDVDTTDLAGNHFLVYNGSSFVKSPFKVAGTPSDGEVLTYSNAAGLATWASPSTGATTVASLTDVDTTGIADGDGIRYDGTDWHAGKWGVGTENQIIPANDDTVNSTTRTVKLNTETDPGASQFTSVTSFDLIDAGNNRLERVSITEVDVGAGPTYAATQEKYGTLILKPDAAGNAAKLNFSNSYSSAGTVMSLSMKSGYSAYQMELPDSGATGKKALTTTSGSTTTTTTLEFTDVGPTYSYQGQAYIPLTGTNDLHYWFAGSSRTGLTGDTAFTNSALSTSAMWNFYKKLSFSLPAGTYDFDFYQDMSVTTDTSGSVHSSQYATEDVEVYWYKVTPGTGGNVTLTQIGSTQYITQDTSDTAESASVEFSVSSVSFSAGDRLLPVTKGTVNLSSNHYGHWSFQIDAFKTA